MLRRGFALSAVAFALLATSCGGSSSSSDSGSGGDTITIKSFDYAPQTLTVKTGGTVTVKNTDSSAHTATAKEGSFDTGSIPSGSSKTITFSKAGTFQYHCTIHGFMPTRTVTVTG